VQGNYNQSGLLTLEKLSYGYMEIDLDTFTQVMVDRLVRCLERNFDWRSVRDEQVAQDEHVGVVLEKGASAPSPAIAVSASSATRKASRGKAVATKESRLKKPAEAAEAKASKKTAKIKKLTPKRATPTRKRRAPPRKKGFLEWLFG